MTRRWWTLALVGTLSVLLLWLAALTLPIKLSSRISTTDAQHYGPLGDMFGAASALFSGLGFLAVVLVLAWDIQERKRDLRDREQARRPYVTAKVESDQFSVQRAKWTAGHFSLALEMLVTLENATDDLALNVAVSSSLLSGQTQLSSKPHPSGPPLGPKGLANVSLLYETSGEEAQALITSLRSGQSLIVPVEVSYENLNGSGWTSSVTYLIECERLADRTLLERVLDRETGEFIEGSGPAIGRTNSVLMTPRAKAGSWSQSPN